MTNYLQIWRDSKEYTFNVASFHATMDYPVYLVGTVNFGLAPVTRITQRGPFENGDTDVDFRINPRVMNIPIVVPASSYDDMMQKRSDLMKVFKPGNDVTSYRMTWNDGVHGTQIRKIDGRIAGGLQFDTSSTEYTIRTVVQLRCADPTWYDDTVTNYDLTALSWGTPTPIPRLYPVTYGTDQNTINKITTFTYDGSWNAYPILVLTGGLDDVVITDTLGHVIRIDVAIDYPNVWTITLGDNITIVDQNGVNKFEYLNIDSDLTRWAVYAASGTVPDGVNTISVSASGSGTISMSFNTRYVGV